MSLNSYSYVCKDCGCEKGIDYNGCLITDGRLYGQTLESCIEACDAYSECTRWIFSMREDHENRCWLKNGETDACEYKFIEKRPIYELYTTGLKGQVCCDEVDDMNNMDSTVRFTMTALITF